MRVLLVVNDQKAYESGSSYAGRLRPLLPENTMVLMAEYEGIDVIPPDITHIILTGSRHTHGIDASMQLVHTNFHLITHALRNRLPLLGICFGFQLICVYFGSEMFCRRKAHHGLYPIFFNKNFLGAKAGQTLMMHENHKHHVTRVHPNLLEVCAEQHGEVAAIRCLWYPVYAVQFHPCCSHHGRSRILRPFLQLSPQLHHPRQQDQ